MQGFDCIPPGAPDVLIDIETLPEIIVSGFDCVAAGAPDVSIDIRYSVVAFSLAVCDEPVSETG